MMTVVCGPPGAGKTTWVRAQRGRGDLVVDVDALFAALTLRERYDKPDALLPAVLDVRDYVIERLWPAWVISTNASWRYRQYMRTEFGARVVVLETPAEECLRRIAADPGREGRADWPLLVETWWQSYEADERDERIAPAQELA